MKFEDLNKYLTGIFMFKIQNGISPKIIQNLFTVNVNIHSYSTRQSKNFHIFPHRTNVSLFSIKNHGPKIWNEIPIPVRQNYSIYLFKKSFKGVYVKI